jgi:hypothetical protein
MMANRRSSRIFSPFSPLLLGLITDPNARPWLDRPSFARCACNAIACAFARFNAYRRPWRIVRGRPRAAQFGAATSQA